MSAKVSRNRARGGAQSILLVTAKDETQDIVTLMIGGLPRRDLNHFLRPFARGTLVRRSSVDTAMELLQNRQSSPEPAPILIVVDALAPKDASQPSSGNGVPTSTLLAWLDKNFPDIPVIVVSRKSIERLDLKVLARRNVALWELEVSSARGTQDFAKILLSFDRGAEIRPRRIIVEVQRHSARYRIGDGYHEFTTEEKPYPDQREVAFLINASAGFSPYDSNNVPDPNWQTSLTSWGQSLFKLFLADALEPSYFDFDDLPTPAVTLPKRNPSIDLRFAVDVSSPESAELFKLPFEVVNCDWKADHFLCTRIPMARHIIGSSGNHTAPHFGQGETVLKVLAVDAAMGGNVSIVHDMTGKRSAARVSPLSYTRKEIDALSKLADVTVIPSDSSPVRGAAMRDAIESTLRDTQFDIFHFSGHSISDDKGGTFLILPGDPGEGLAVSVRTVADWVRARGCRLVILSSCRSASMQTAVEMMAAGAEAVVGFRWNADEELAADYFEQFYRAYLKQRRSVSQSYRQACYSVQRSRMGVPLWASAIAITRD